MQIKFLSENIFFEWKSDFWMKIRVSNETKVFEKKRGVWISLLHKHWAFTYKINIFEWNESYLKENAAGIEHKN